MTVLESTGKENPAASVLLEGSICSDTAGDEYSKSLRRQQATQFLPSDATKTLRFIFVVFSMVMGGYLVSGLALVLLSIAEKLNASLPFRVEPTLSINLGTAAIAWSFTRLCEVYGCYRVLFYGHTWLIFWLFFSAFSTNNAVLLVCRAMQGLGSAALLPAGIAICGQACRPRHKDITLYTIYSAFACIGLYLGLIFRVVAGDFIDCRVYFWIGASTGCTICGFGLFSIPNDSNKTPNGPTAEMSLRYSCISILGLVLTAFAVLGARHTHDGWASSIVRVPLVFGFMLLLGIVYARYSEPESRLLMSRRLFEMKNRRWLTVVLFCAYGTFGLSLYFAISLYANPRSPHKTPSKQVASLTSLKCRAGTAIRYDAALRVGWSVPFGAGSVCLAIVCGLAFDVVPGRLVIIICGGAFAVLTLTLSLIPYQVVEDGLAGFTYWVLLFPAVVSSMLH